MFRPRLIDARSSGLPQSVGLCATDITSIAAIINESQERLINDAVAPSEGWWGGWAQMVFTVSQASPTIVAPAEVSRIIAIDVCKTPVRINNQFFEFLLFGKGFQSNGCGVNPCQSSLAAYERETVTTFAPLLATPQYIRCYASDPTDISRSILVQGKDQNGVVIRFLDPLANSSGLGETIVLDSPFATSVNLFSEIFGVQKQKTYGEVQVFQVSPDTGLETPLLVMSPGETTASYRKYHLAGLPSNCCNVPGGLQVLALCKLDFVPAVADSDYLRIMSIPALLDECMAVRFGRMDTVGAQQLSAAKHASALRLLFGQLDNYMSRENPAIQRKLFGSDPIRAIAI